MRLPRSAGVLLHPTSLPGPHGIGDLGPEAFQFLEVLHEADISLWQMLPLGPTGYGNSPYQCFSSFAGNPLLIHVASGTRHPEPPNEVDFPRVLREKRSLLRLETEAFTPDDLYLPIWIALGRVETLDLEALRKMDWTPLRLDSDMSSTLTQAKAHQAQDAQQKAPAQPSRPDKGISLNKNKSPIRGPSKPKR